MSRCVSSYFILCHGLSCLVLFNLFSCVSSYSNLCPVWSRVFFPCHMSNYLSYVVLSCLVSCFVCVAPHVVSSWPVLCRPVRYVFLSNRVSSYSIWWHVWSWVYLPCLVSLCSPCVNPFHLVMFCIVYIFRLMCTTSFCLLVPLCDMLCLVPSCTVLYPPLRILSSYSTLCHVLSCVVLSILCYIFSFVGFALFRLTPACVVLSVLCRPNLACIMVCLGSSGPVMRRPVHRMSSYSIVVMFLSCIVLSLFPWPFSLCVSSLLSYPSYVALSQPASSCSVCVVVLRPSCVGLIHLMAFLSCVVLTQSVSPYFSFCQFPSCVVMCALCRAVRPLNLMSGFSSPVLHNSGCETRCSERMIKGVNFTCQKLSKCVTCLPPQRIY